MFYLYQNSSDFSIFICASGTYRRVTTHPVGAPGNPGLRAIQLVNSKEAYVLGANDSKIYPWTRENSVL